MMRCIFIPFQTFASHQDSAKANHYSIVSIPESAAHQLDAACQSSLKIPISWSRRYFGPTTLPCHIKPGAPKMALA
jgi:hypothetical protein